jgi:hypothetical protein
MMFAPMEWPLFRTPMRMIIGGSSGTGKTSIVQTLLNEQEHQFGFDFDVIKYCMSAPDPIYQKLAADLQKLELCDGIPYDFIGSPGEYVVPGDNTLLVMDDLITVASKSTAVNELFTVNARHYNISVILITQNVFYDSPFLRNINLNSTHLITTENNRDPGQFKMLARQLEPKHYKELEKFRERVKKWKRFSHIVSDLHPLTPRHLRYFSGISIHEPRVYADMPQ